MLDNILEAINHNGIGIMIILIVYFNALIHFKYRKRMNKMVKSNKTSKAPKTLRNIKSAVIKPKFTLPQNPNKEEDRCL